MNGVAMTLQEAKSIARHLGLTLRNVRSGDYRVNFREGGSGSTHSSGWQRLSVAERWYGLKLRDPRTSWLTVVPPRVAPRPKISGAPGSAACDRLSRSTPGRRRAVA